MLPRLHTVIYIYSAIQSFVNVVTSECPRDAQHRIQLCIKSSLPNFGLGPPLDATRPVAIKTSIQMSRDSCQTNKLEASAKCMQDFLDLCQGTTDREQLLQRLFDKQKIMQTVQYFCASLPTFEKYAECITNQHEMAVNCSLDEAMKYKKMMEAKATDDVLLQANCRFHSIATSCLEDSVYDNCGIEAADFIETITIAQTPPSCEAKERKYSQSSPTDCSYNIKSNYLTILMIVFIKVILR